MLSFRWARLALPVAAAVAMIANAQATPLKPAPMPPEQQLITALDQIRDGRSGLGLQTLSELVRTQPNFRLANLLYADTLAARSGKPGIIADEEDPRIKELAEEARLRVAQANFAPPPGTVPDNVLRLATEYPYLVLVDLPRARMHLFENLKGELKLIRSSYAAMGKAGYGKTLRGDNRTPVGIYHITGWIADTALPELYGSGALPLNYPNLWDRFRTKTGSGIWLHGVPPQTYVRAPRSSEGCVTMANDDLLALKPYVVNNRAPVVLSDKVEWISAAKAKAEREGFLARVEDWRKKWSAKDTDGYLSFYGDDFSTDGMNKPAFAEHKRRVNAGKKFIDVQLSDVSLFRYPGEPMMLAEFTLSYKSDNYKMSTKKEQYWRLDKKGQWRIFREENRDV